MRKLPRLPDRAIGQCLVQPTPFFACRPIAENVEFLHLPYGEQLLEAFRREGAVLQTQPLQTRQAGQRFEPGSRHLSFVED